MGVGVTEAPVHVGTHTPLPRPAEVTLGGLTREHVNGGKIGQVVCSMMDGLADRWMDGLVDRQTEQPGGDYLAGQGCLGSDGWAQGEGRKEGWIDGQTDR